jgi:CheY-like chemotaxis protein
VLLDLSLNVSGLEMARAMKQNHRTAEIPLMALSGHTGGEIASKAPLEHRKRHHRISIPQEFYLSIAIAR